MMEIKKLTFEKKEVQIKETYIDKTGKTQERIKTVMVSTGNVMPDDFSHTDSTERNEKASC